ncbi:shikimate kinase [compost metagenome]
MSLWLKADIEVLWERVNKRDHRPLLKTENPKATLAALMEKRYPIYAEADMTIESRDVRKEIIVTEVLAAIAGLEQKD